MAVAANRRRLATELGPDKGVSTGSVGRFIESAANALDGNGDKLRQTLAQLSGVGRILADGSGNIVDTITNLQTFTAYINSTIPNATAGLSFALYAMWDDLDNNTPSVLLHQATVENSVPVEIIQWNTFHHGTTNGNGMLQAKIFAPGGPALVQYLYQDLTWNWNGNSATIGVQWSATNAFQFSYGANNAAGGPIPNNAVLSVVGTATGPTLASTGTVFWKSTLTN